MREIRKFKVTMKREHDSLNDFMNSGGNAHGVINDKKFWVEARNGMMVIHSPENPITRHELNRVVDFMEEEY